MVKRDRAGAAVSLAIALFAAAGGSRGDAAPAKPALTGMWTLDQADFEKRETPPFTAEAKRLVAAQQAEIEAGKVINAAQLKCLPPGTPSMMLGEFALELLETPGRVTIISEMSPLVRTVYLNRTGPSEGLEPMWNGYSVGKRDGDALVVHTDHFNDRPAPIGFGGTVHTSATAMTERFELSADGRTMTIRTTLTDPRLLAAPYTLVRHYTRLPEDAELWEYVCEIAAAGWSERIPGEGRQPPD